MKNKIGILVAGNAGCPGGKLGRMDGRTLREKWVEIKDYPYTTQEESVVRDWLAASAEKHSDPKMKPWDWYKINLGSGKSGKVERPWGMVHPDYELKTRGAKHTIQKHDYTLPLKGHSAYYDHAYTFKDGHVNWNKCSTDPFPATLVFVYGPNVACSQSPTGSTARTCVQGYTQDQYPYFKAAVKTAMQAGMLAMEKAGVTVGVLARISGGIYAASKQGDQSTKTRINQDYSKIVNEIIAENKVLQTMRFVM